MMNPAPRKPELLAPAGTIECFHAAIDAGADAVYLGLEDFNARLRARNFTTRTLSYVVPYAHSCGVKVYVALNTLVKQEELRAVAETLCGIARIGVDACIVTDPGLIMMARAHFPELELHGSTQMFLHNAPAFEWAHRRGLSRAILPRELTIDEIARLAKGAKVQLEVFCHGALCYSFSGRCLASSFCGGGSGNRGRCTQVCRRIFESPRGRGSFFSPRDLQAIELVPRFAEMGIAALKIEGRMRSAEYVRTVVRAYRAAIDNHGNIPSLLESLRFDTGRAKTFFFLNGVRQKGIIDIDNAGTGLFLGRVTGVTPAGFHVAAGENVSAGDRVRVHPASGYEGEAFTVASVSRKEDGLLIKVAGASSVNAGDRVYLIGRKPVKGDVGKEEKITIRPADPGTISPLRIAEMMNIPESKAHDDGQEQVLVKINNPAWLPHCIDIPADGVICAFTLDDFVRYAETLTSWPPSNIPCLPPWISRERIGRAREIIGTLEALGARTWMCGHPGQRSLFGRHVKVIADHTAGCLNRHCQAALRDMHFDGFCYPLEDDFPNLRRQASASGNLYVYAHVPLFMSRVRPDLSCRSSITDAAGRSFFTVEREGLFYLIGKEPLCLFHKIGKLHDAGISSYILDLGFTTPDRAVVDSLMNSFWNREKVPGSTMFNFKLGLR